MHHLWADALAPLYAVGDTSKSGGSKQDSTTNVRKVARWAKDAMPQVRVQGKVIDISNIAPANRGVTEVSLVSAIGTVVEKIHTKSNTVRFSSNISAGHYFVVVRNANRYSAMKVVVR
jgi:hypothetical protein